jgi:hypothetical protein
MIAKSSSQIFFEDAFYNKQPKQRFCSIDSPPIMTFIYSSFFINKYISFHFSKSNPLRCKLICARYLEFSANTLSKNRLANSVFNRPYREIRHERRFSASRQTKDNRYHFFLSSPLPFRTFKSPRTRSTTRRLLSFPVFSLRKKSTTFSFVDLGKLLVSSTNDF